MRVLLTGATGFIGSAIVPELLGAGHEVVGLARSDASAAALRAAGADVQRGDLHDLDVLRAAATAADGVIHTAYVHDFARLAESGPIDLRAVEAFGEALAGSDRPLVVTSGIAVLTPGRLGHEDDAPDPGSAGIHRIPSEEATRALAAQGVRSSVVRLAPSVHGAGDHGFVPVLVDTARRTGVSGFIDDGANRWPAVHRLDAARLFRLALERAPAGSTLHGVAEQGIPVRAIAEAIGQGLDLPVRGIAADQAAEHFAWLAGFLAADLPASSARTRELTGWEPEQPGLLDDLARSYGLAPVGATPR